LKGTVKKRTAKPPVTNMEHVATKVRKKGSKAMLGELRETPGKKAVPGARPNFYHGIGEGGKGVKGEPRKLEKKGRKKLSGILLSSTYRGNRVHGRQEESLGEVWEGLPQGLGSKGGRRAMLGNESRRNRWNEKESLTAEENKWRNHRRADEHVAVLGGEGEGKAGEEEWEKGGR